MSSNSESWLDILLDEEIEAIKTANIPLRVLTVLFFYANFIFAVSGLGLIFWAYIAGGERWSDWVTMGARSLSAGMFSFFIYLALGEACICYWIAENKKAAHVPSVFCYIIASVLFLYFIDAFGVLGGTLVKGNIDSEHPGSLWVFAGVIYPFLLYVFILAFTWILVRFLFTALFGYFIEKDEERYKKQKQDEHERVIKSKDVKKKKSLVCQTSSVTPYKRESYY